jgi:hypothetical protein
MTWKLAESCLARDATLHLQKATGQNIFCDTVYLEGNVKSLDLTPTDPRVTRLTDPTYLTKNPSEPNI